MSNVVYRFCCPGCSEYIGKTDRNLHKCLEHATTMDSAIFDHLNSCKKLNDIKNLMHYDLPVLEKCQHKGVLYLLCED